MIRLLYLVPLNGKTLSLWTKIGFSEYVDFIVVLLPNIKIHLSGYHHFISEALWEKKKEIKLIKLKQPWNKPKVDLFDVEGVSNPTVQETKTCVTL